MKKSKHIELILITAALASCHKPEKEWETGKKVYMRSDTTAEYSHARTHNGISPLLWYFAFRPYGNYGNNGYQRSGYYSNAISQRSNVGNSGFKSSVLRGGFGRSSYFASS